MLEILETFSQEAFDAAKLKAQELKFDLNKGTIGLDESFINIKTFREILTDAIKKNKLNQLPITIQNSLLTKLEGVSKQLTGLINGTDTITPLTTAIEELNVYLWQFGFHNLSEEVLGYQSKLNQLKHLEVRSKNLELELEKGIALKSSLEALKAEVEGFKTIGDQRIKEAQEAANKTKTSFEEVTKLQQEVSAKLETVKEKEKLASDSLSKTQSSNLETSAITSALKTFHAEVENHRKMMSETKDLAETSVEKYKTEISAFMERLKVLEKEIEGHLVNATGASLFASFQKRKEELVKSKLLWMKLALGASALVFALTIYIALTTGNIDKGFFIKLGGYLPLLFLIIFCTKNYSHERILEEEYAFKSNISLSLEPYRNLVEEVVTDKDAEKYSDFIIKSVTNVFSSPTDKVFSSQHDELGLDKATQNISGLIKEIGGVVKELSGVVKSIKSLKD